MTLKDAVDAQLQSSLVLSGRGDAREVVGVGPLRVVRDAPGRKRPARLENFIILGVDPSEAMNVIKAYKPKHWIISVIAPVKADHDALKETYKSFGYRLNIRFPYYVKSLSAQLDVPVRFSIERVIDQDLVNAIWKAKGRRPPKSPFQSGNADVRMYSALVDEKPVGWVTSVRATTKSNWVSDLYVLESHRGKRIGEQLMREMLEEDRKYKVKNSALLSTSDGSNLYRRLGYEQVGLMQIFAPIRR